MRRRRPTYFWKLFRLKAQWISSSATLRTATGDWMVTWVLPGGFSNHHVCTEVGALTEGFLLRQPGSCLHRENSGPSSGPLSQPHHPFIIWWKKAISEMRKNLSRNDSLFLPDTRKLRCRPHCTVRVGPDSSQGHGNHPAYAERDSRCPFIVSSQVNPLLLC